MAVNIFKKPGRQTKLCAEVAFTFADLLSPTDINGVTTEIVDMPEGSIVTDLQLIVETAWNSGTSDVIDIGDDNGSGVVDRYIDGADLQTKARTQEDIDADPETVVQYTAGDRLTINWVSVGADATAGAARILVEYIIADRANETQGLKVTNYGAARAP